MMTLSPETEVRAARRAVRRHARGLMREPTNVSKHLARLQASMHLPGVEPAQGVLADMYVSLDSSQSGVKRAALTMVKDRLSAHVANWFESLTDAGAVHHITPLATRWSVLATSSADISTRARRCSADDSRLLAQQVMPAIHENDQDTLQAFLHHCLTCHDNLAFMLARRAVMRAGLDLPAGWDEVSQQLEKSMELA